MQITVTGRHMDATEALQDYVQQKIGRASKIVDQDTMSAEVVLRHERNPKIENPDIAEVTLFMKGRVVRAEEAAGDMYAAIDLASDKLEQQLRKYKTKLLDKRDSGAIRLKTAPGDSQLAEAVEPEPEPEVREPQIVREKSVDMKPMTEDEAILQLELLGHDFFVFQHAETDSITVLYRRDDGDYGVIRAMS